MNRFGRNLGLKKNGSKNFSPRKDAQREQITPFLMCCFCFTLLFPLEKLNVLEVPQHHGFFGVKNHHFCEFPKGLSLNPNQKPLKNNTCTILFCFRQLWVIFFGFKFLPGFQKPIISLRAPSEPSAPWRFGRTEKVIFFWGGVPAPPAKRDMKLARLCWFIPFGWWNLNKHFFSNVNIPKRWGKVRIQCRRSRIFFQMGWWKNHQFFSNFLMYICYRGLLWLLCLGPKSHLRKAAGIFMGSGVISLDIQKKRSCFMRRNGYSPGN